MPTYNSSAERVIVPGIGIASQQIDGVVEVLYPDNSRLAVKQPEQGGGITYTEPNGSQCHYTAREMVHIELPDMVRDRLKQIPIVINHLMAHNSPTMPSCTPASNKCMQPQMKFFR